MLSFKFITLLSQAELVQYLPKDGYRLALPLNDLSTDRSYERFWCLDLVVFIRETSKITRIQFKHLAGVLRGYIEKRRQASCPIPSTVGQREHELSLLGMYTVISFELCSCSCCVDDDQALVLQTILYVDSKMLNRNSNPDHAR